MIGMRFRLKREILGNSAGTIGYVFNQYPDFDVDGEFGFQIIFRNGDYDGFSFNERELYLEEDGFEEKYVDYEFQNVMQVSQDFADGYWNFEKQ